MFDLLRKKITGFVNGLLKKEETKPEIIKEEKIKTLPEKKRPEVKIGVASQIKALITGEIEISEDDVGELLERFELEMLESDVAIDAAASIKTELKERLVGKKVSKKELDSFVREVIVETLTSIMDNKKVFDIVERVRDTEKPVRIMFIGPNGSGKTTSIAKVADMLMAAGYKVIFAAADTFRAAAVEQIDVHGHRLGVRTIKRDYGVDPTAVAYDAVTYAKAHGIDAVLIDTAGRQETNTNLLNELKKMNRVIKPQLKIYVGESIAGHVIVEQVSKFNKEIGIDGIILTKLDCDPKGGAVLSISRITDVPVIYIGTGQTYQDIEKFDPKKIAERIVG